MLVSLARVQTGGKAREGDDHLANMSRSIDLD